MLKPVDLYVAQLKTGPNTKGVGNQPLAPKVLADGTKVFHLTAKLADWEVEPGKTVRAWTFNGTVPGPWIKVNVGDHVRVVVDNKLPMSTGVHFHGLEVPFDDGRRPRRHAEADQARRVSSSTSSSPRARSSGMYHSHHNAQVQVPNGMLGIFQVGDVGAARRHRARDPGSADGAERRRRDRPDAQRQVVPRDRAGDRAPRRLGRDRLLQRGPADPPDAPARPAAARDRGGRLPAAVAVHRRHDRRSRRASGSRRSCT